MSAVCRSTECSEYNENNGRGQKGICARPFVTEIAKEKLPHDCTDESDRSNILLGTGARIRRAIDDAEQSGNGPNDLNHEHVVRT